MSKSFSLRILAPSAVVASIFYGNIKLGLTIPIALLFLPAAAFAARPSLRSFPLVALVCLACLGGIVGVQYLIGVGPSERLDFMPYLPIVYAAVTLLLMSRSSTPDESLWRAIVIGVVISGALMLLSAFLLEGDSDSINAYYAAKNLFRNPLGASNYLAVFFLFAGVVALYTSKWSWAVLFFVFCLVTLSRFGTAFAILAGITFTLDSKKLVSAGALVTIVGSALLAAVLASSGTVQSFPNITGLESMTDRLRLWSLGVDASFLSPWLGHTQSHMGNAVNGGIVFNPHSSVLQVTSLFGVGGLAAYSGYIFLGLREIAGRGRGSTLWRGIFVAVMLMLLWSLVEIIVLTPAFEMLFAALYMIARSQRLRGTEQLKTE